MSHVLNRYLERVPGSRGKRQKKGQEKRGTLKQLRGGPPNGFHHCLVLLAFLLALSKAPWNSLKRSILVEIRETAREREREIERYRERESAENYEEKSEESMKSKEERNAEDHCEEKSEENNGEKSNEKSN